MKKARLFSLETEDGDRGGENYYITRPEKDWPNDKERIARVYELEDAKYIIRVLNHAEHLLEQV